MAEFIQDFKFVQATDGKSATFTDLSNWDDNDENYTREDFTRTVVLLDAYGEEIDTVILASDEDTFTIELTKDLWVDVTATFDEIAGSANFEKLERVPLDRFLIIAYKKKVKQVKNNQSVLNVLSNANVFIQAANYATPVGNAVEYQENIDAAYAYLIPC